MRSKEVTLNEMTKRGKLNFKNPRLLEINFIIIYKFSKIGILQYIIKIDDIRFKQSTRR